MKTAIESFVNNDETAFEVVRLLQDRCRRLSEDPRSAHLNPFTTNGLMATWYLACDLDDILEDKDDYYKKEDITMGDYKDDDE